MKVTIAFGACMLIQFSLFGAQAQEIVDGNQPPTVRNDMHSCPTGYIVTGVNVAANLLLCTGYFKPESGSMIHNEIVDRGMRPDNQWPPDNFTSVAYNYIGPAMHWCGPNRFITGIHVARNAFNCAEFIPGDTRNYNPRLKHVVLDLGTSPTVRNGMHACPPGTVLVGAHFDTNTFLCGELPFCRDDSQCTASRSCEYVSVPGEVLAKPSGVCRKTGRLRFQEAASCRGDSLGSLTDRSGNEVHLGRNSAFSENDAESLYLNSAVHGGTVFTVYDEPDDPNDDWARYLVKQNPEPSGYCITTFERSFSDSRVMGEYHREIGSEDNDLDDAVSMIEIYSGIIGEGGKCVDINLNNNSVQIFGCHGGDNQSWQYMVNGEIRSRSGLCLEAREDQINQWQSGGLREARVRVATCSGGINQMWSITEADEIRMFGDLCLDIRGGNPIDHASVQIFPCHGGPNQRWSSSF